MSHYRPESKEDKKKRLTDKAALEAKGGDAKSGDKPKHIKFGINHVTQLVEERKAKLVVIAHDVDPIELVVWLPALCRKMDIPYCIVKGKARLGHLVRQKNCTAVALTDVRKEDHAKLEQIIASVKNQYSEPAKIGGGIL